MVCCTQVIDELSDDETPQRLQEYGIRMVTPPERLGVTYNWNLVSQPPTTIMISSASPAHDKMCGDAAGAPGRHQQLEPGEPATIMRVRRLTCTKTTQMVTLPQRPRCVGFGLRGSMMGGLDQQQFACSQGLPADVPNSADACVSPTPQASLCGRRPSIIGFILSTTMC